MSEKEISLGRLFVQEAVKAGTWGIIFLVVMSMFFTTIKKDIKEGIEFGVQRMVDEVVFYGTHPYLVEKTKQLVKEGIEYSLNMAAAKASGVLAEQSRERGPVKKPEMKSIEGKRKPK